MLKLDDLGRRGGLNALRPGARNDPLKPESGSERQPTSLPASLRALAVSRSTRGQRCLVRRWVQGWRPLLDRGYAPGISPGDDAHDDDSASPPRGVKEAAQSSGRSEDQQANRVTLVPK